MTDLSLHHFTCRPGVSIVNFEQVNVGLRMFSLAKVSSVDL